MDTKVDLHRFSDEIEKIERQLDLKPPQKGGILFYGSSTMGNWRVDDMCYNQMAPLPVSNTGFGGATAEEALYYYHRLVFRVRPSVLVYYEGANDLTNKYTPVEVIDISHRLFEWARQDFPNIQFVIMPIKLCPGMHAIESEAKICNELFSEYAEQHDDTRMLDVSSLLYDAKGDYRTDIYLEDMLHHNLKGYEELTALLKPVLKEIYG